MGPKAGHPRACTVPRRSGRRRHEAIQVPPAITSARRARWRVHCRSSSWRCTIPIWHGRLRPTATRRRAHRHEVDGKRHDVPSSASSTVITSRLRPGLPGGPQAPRRGKERRGEDPADVAEGDAATLTEWPNSPTATRPSPPGRRRPRAGQNHGVYPWHRRFSTHAATSPNDRGIAGTKHRGQYWCPRGWRSP